MDKTDTSTPKKVTATTTDEMRKQLSETKNHHDRRRLQEWIAEAEGIDIDCQI